MLLGTPTDDSVEVAIEFVKECGFTLQELTPQGLHGIFERFRGILHEGEIDKRVQFMIEGLFAFRKGGFEGKRGVPPELDLVEEEDQIVHEIGLDDEMQAQPGLDVFKEDPDFEENERRYADIKREILGESSSSESDSDRSSSSSSSSSSEEPQEPATAVSRGDGKIEIADLTETNLVNLRRTIYLTIMSSLDFEEAGHKLMKLNIPPGAEVELCTMLVECCSQERTYLRYYGLLAQRFCFINKIYPQLFDEVFMKQYSTIHRLETNKLRNVAKFFAHLLATDAMSWTCMAYISLTEEATTSSSRIFIKILFQELAEAMGLKSLNARMQDPELREYFQGVMPKDEPRNTRFSINFFTSISLGALTDDMREWLKNAPKTAPKRSRSSSSSSSSSGSSSSSSSSSSSDSSSRSSGSSSHSSSYSSSSSRSRSRSRSYTSSSYTTSSSSSHSRGARRKRSRR